MQFIPYAADHEYWAYNRFVVHGIPTDDENAVIKLYNNVGGVEIPQSCPFIYRAITESEGKGLCEKCQEWK